MTAEKMKKNVNFSDLAEFYEKSEKKEQLFYLKRNLFFDSLNIPITLYW